LLSARFCLAHQLLDGGAVFYEVLPPHAPGHFTSETQKGGIGISFSGHRRAARRLDGGPVIESDIAPGAVFLAASSNLSWLRVAEPADALEVHFAPAYLDSVAAELGAPRCAGLPDVGGAADALVWSVSALFRSALRNGRALPDVEASSQARRLAGHVLRRYAGLRGKDRTAGALDRRRLARVTELVDAGLSERLTIETLAAAANLSPFHFARSFRRATGLAPHAYVTARRMERARELLLADGLSTAALGALVGYSNPAHFRESFARWLGMSPAALRRHDRRAAQLA
jgi:AraC family transcriptional regulator